MILEKEGRREKGFFYPGWFKYTETGDPGVSPEAPRPPSEHLAGARMTYSYARGCHQPQFTLTAIKEL